MEGYPPSQQGWSDFFLKIKKDGSDLHPVTELEKKRKRGKQECEYGRCHLAISRARRVPYNLIPWGVLDSEKK